MRKHVFILQAIILLVFSAEITLAAGLSDTGQTKCYDNTKELTPCPAETETFYGQDAHYSYVQQSFTKLNEDGSVWTAGDPENPNPPHVMVRDNVTGLIWAVETGGLYLWNDAKNYCEGLTIGDYSDWRMPTVNELRSIARYEGSPFINTDYFPNTMAYIYWSSDKYDLLAYYRWYFDFDLGTSGYKKETKQPYYVRAVHCRETVCFFPPDYSSFIMTDNENGTLTDIRTGLMWQQVWPSEYPIESPIGFDTSTTWDKAVEYCNGLSLAGFTDWRLPNIKELASMVQLNASPPSFLPKIQADFYWSSTTGKSTKSAITINFGFGTDLSPEKTDTTYGKYYVIAVRGGNYGTFAAKADLNRDSLVNLSDAIIALQVCGGMEPAVDTTFGMANIDIDADLKIGMPEAIYILQEVAGIYRCL